MWNLRNKGCIKVVKNKSNIETLQSDCKNILDIIAKISRSDQLHDFVLNEQYRLNNNKSITVTLNLYINIYICFILVAVVYDLSLK